MISIEKLDEIRSKIDSSNIPSELKGEVGDWLDTWVNSDFNDDAFKNALEEYTEQLSVDYPEDSKVVKSIIDETCAYCKTYSSEMRTYGLLSAVGVAGKFINNNIQAISAVASIWNCLLGTFKMLKGDKTAMDPTTTKSLERELMILEKCKNDPFKARLELAKIDAILATTKNGDKIRKVIFDDLAKKGLFEDKDKKVQEDANKMVLAASSELVSHEGHLDSYSFSDFWNNVKKYMTGEAFAKKFIGAAISTLIVGTATVIATAFQKGTEDTLFAKEKKNELMDIDPNDRDSMSKLVSTVQDAYDHAVTPEQKNQVLLGFVKIVEKQDRNLARNILNDASKLDPVFQNHNGFTNTIGEQIANAKKK